MSLFFLLPTAPDLGTVTLSGETVTTADSAVGDLWCGIRVNTDGTIDRINGDDGAGGPTYTQIDTGTDWIIPNHASARRTFHVKMAKFSGNNLDAGSDTEEVWLELSTARSFYLKTGSFDWDYQGDISISDDGGSTTLDSATYIFDLDNL